MKFVKFEFSRGGKRKSWNQEKLGKFEFSRDNNLLIIIEIQKNSDISHIQCTSQWTCKNNLDA